ncbi:hypothetical protein O9X98_13940 [Agrobacterium salinitolerans]|nr:hypothetical protein [Agrobacterium salinitolerans]
MDAVQRFDRVADYLLDNFAAGNACVSKDDVIDDHGTILGEEAFAVLALIRKEGVLIGDDNRPTDALDTFVQAWNQGFELASGDDLTDDNEPVSAVLAAYRSAPAAALASGPKL